jgi:hypothetical protein
MGPEAMADSAMEMPTGMPCCPDDSAVPDCGKDCPLMALCFAATVLNLTTVTALVVPPKLGSRVLLGNDLDVVGCTDGPSPRPPKT